MSNHDDRPAPRTSADRPTATYPTATYPTARQAGGARPGPGPFAGWRDQAQTEELPAVSPDAGRPSPSPAIGTRRSRRPRVSTPAKPTSGREARRTAPAGTKGLRRRPVLRPRLARHLRAAVAGILIAAALLGALQLLALDGIAQAGQAALQNAQSPMSGRTAPMSVRTFDARDDVRSDIPAEWATQDTGAPYGRTNPTASPLDLPRRTTSPDTPLPCLATISPDSRRAVVLEEDSSLTALVRR